MGGGGGGEVGWEMGGEVGEVRTEYTAVKRSVYSYMYVDIFPCSRQTLLFSATLPKLLIDFAKAG